MVTEQELLEAIAECENEPPSFTSIKKLASLYTVYDHLYSSGKPRVGKTIMTEEDSEFLQAVNGKEIGKVLRVIDELMETLSVIYPKAYESVLAKIKKLP